MPIVPEADQINVEQKYSSSLESQAAGSTARMAEPCVAVIFGASGDLARRKLLPAFYHLAKSHLLADHFCIVGFARSPLTTETFRDLVRDSVCSQHATDGDFDLKVCDWIVERAWYVTGDYRDTNACSHLRQTLREVDERYKTRGNYLYYLATPPDLFISIVEQLDSCGLAKEGEGTWHRFIVEKPFGHDLQSAKELNRELLKILKETQVYRIDHYLGKETVQNILVFRFSNSIFEPVWNRRYVDHVEITVAESIGVEGRGAFYDRVGALRDMVPSHLMQLLSLTSMEPPTSFQADAVRDEQTKVLRAAQPFDPEDVLMRAVRGQYDQGIVERRWVPGYRAEPSVDPHSTTETFVALKLFIDNWRWANVPFYIRTGKRLPKRLTEICVHFRKAPLILFRNTAVEELAPNALVIHVQPDEAISLEFGMKIPGPQIRVGSVKMGFRYADYFKAAPHTGYERLLYDCMIGDATLFQRADMVEAGWAAVDPVLDVWRALPPRDFPNYAGGTWGPEESFELMKRDGRRWREE
jgi:glucose-6-phosphate 1-dehydrogenase